MDAASVIAVILALLFSAAILVPVGLICYFFYCLMYDAAVPSDYAFGNWREEPDHPNWYLEKEFKRKFRSGVGVTVIVVAIVLVLIFN